MFVDYYINFVWYIKDKRLYLLDKYLFDNDNNEYDCEKNIFLDSNQIDYTFKIIDIEEDDDFYIFKVDSQSIEGSDLLLLKKVNKINN